VIGVAAFASLTIITVASLIFAVKTDPARARARRESIAERRRILERDRAEWAKSFHADSSADRDQRIGATRCIQMIDHKLLKLAEEEAKL